jgi:hypothetical protein
MITPNPVVSSNIDTIGYKSGDLYIRFKKNGLVYVYRKVSFATFFSLLKSDSVGKFFNRFVKPLYTCEKLSHDPFVA